MLAQARAPGQVAIAASEVLAYQQLHRVRFTSWEVDTLQALAAAMANVAAAIPRPKPKKATP